jgi:hypothetical protein
MANVLASAPAAGTSETTMMSVPVALFRRSGPRRWRLPLQRPMLTPALKARSDF